MVDLPPTKLAVLPRDHPLAAEPDASHCDWLLERLSAWDATTAPRVDSVVPAGHRPVVAPGPRWVVSSEIDFERTFVAASEALAHDLLDHDGLEVHPTSGDVPADLARDDHATA